jgi:antitoxin CptB
MVAAKRIKTSCYADARAGAIGAVRRCQPGRDRVAVQPIGVKRDQVFSRGISGRTCSMRDDMTEELDIRRRRAAYRAAHRGTKEMDALVGRFADARIGTLAGSDLDQFERFLAVADPTLQNWIFGKEAVAGSEFAGLVDDIRAFHGLNRLTDATE